VTTSIPPIPMREALHFLGWRGQRIEQRIFDQIHGLMNDVREKLTASVVTRSFEMEEGGRLSDTIFVPEGNDVYALLKSCDSVILMAATLGTQSERMLLRAQARSSADALLLDAVLSAAIEAVCDEAERTLRREHALFNLHLTDRFSPGYGDMPIKQTGEICRILETQKTIGLTVSHNGIMIPRKSVTALLGVSRIEQQRRPSACAVCNMRKTCALRERE